MHQIKPSQCWNFNYQFLCRSCGILSWQEGGVWCPAPSIPGRHWIEKKGGGNWMRTKKWFWRDSIFSWNRRCWIFEIVSVLPKMYSTNRPHRLKTQICSAKHKCVLPIKTHMCFESNHICVLPYAWQLLSDLASETAFAAAAAMAAAMAAAVAMAAMATATMAAAQTAAAATAAREIYIKKGRKRRSSWRRRQRRRRLQWRRLRRRWNDMQQGGAGGGHRSHGSRGLVRDSVELGGLHLVELFKMSYYSSKDYSEFLGPNI